LAEFAPALSEGNCELLPDMQVFWAREYPTIKERKSNGMTESSTDSAVGIWSAPECPYTVEYSTRVLDDIRLAVVDAFYSLPRGGA